MEDRDHIKELFQEKLSGMESSVRPELWNGIASQIGTAAPAAAGISVISKIAIGVGVAASLTLGVYFITKDTNVEKEKNSESIVQQTPDLTEEETRSPEEITSSERKEVNNDDSNRILSPTSLNESSEDLVHDHKIDHNIIDHGYDLPKPDRKRTDDTYQQVDQLKVDPVTSAQEDKGTDTNTETSQEASTVHTEYNLSMPNVFTPNGDGVHDVLFIESEGLTDFNLIVLDSQNKVVWSTSDPDFEWNGVGLNGEPVPAGNYVYFITAKDPSGKAFNKSSRLSVIRTR
jgi:gliding motility-associated-like protein